MSADASSPDVETASADYASRFAGASGRFLLGEQDRTVERALGGDFGRRLLDVGGGHGQLRALYARAGVPFVLHGSDPACFARLGPPGPTEGRVVSDLRALPFADGAFDTVLAVRLLCHLDDWELVLREMCRVASDRVLFDFPTVQGINGLTPLLFSFKRRVERNTRTYRNFRMNAFDEALAGAGFEPARTVKQFFLPLVLHRVLGNAAASRAAEALPRAAGLTALAGSPVVMVGRRRRPPAGAGR